MRACFNTGPVLLLVAIATSGCAWSRGDCGPPASAAAASLDCQIVEPRPVIPDLTSLPVGLPPPAVHSYCNLPERGAQCLAAANSSNGNLLEQEAAAARAQPWRLFHKKRLPENAADILQLRATHERNRDASLALQALLHLAEAEKGAMNISRRIQEVGEMLESVKRLQGAGLASPVSSAELDFQRLGLLHQRIEAEATIEQLNHQLAKLLGGDPPPGARFWPDVDLRVDPAAPSVEEVQGLALIQRADLAAIRLAAGSSGSTSSSWGALMGAPLGVGVAGSTDGRLAGLHPHGSEQADIRQGQSDTALAQQDRAVSHEAAEAVAIVLARLSQVSLSRERLLVQQRRMEDARLKEQVAPSAGFEARRAMLDVLAAEQDLFHDCIEWKIAVVKLKEAEGELAMECGFLAAVECGQCGRF
jgi:hypothetical protein